MDDKIHDKIRVDEREEDNGDLIWQPKCNIINEESHPTCSNIHIDVQHHFVQEQVENGKVMFEYCSIDTSRNWLKCSTNTSRNWALYLWLHAIISYLQLHFEIFAPISCVGHICDYNATS
jgi:hypothetical protein